MPGWAALDWIWSLSIDRLFQTVLQLSNTLHPGEVSLPNISIFLSQLLAVLSGFSSSLLFLKIFGMLGEAAVLTFSDILKSFHLRSLYPDEELIPALLAEEREQYTEWRALSYFSDTNMSISEWRSVRVFWIFACQHAEKASKCKWVFLKTAAESKYFISFLHTLKRPCYKDHDSKSPIPRDRSTKLPEQEVVGNGWLTEVE